MRICAILSAIFSLVSAVFGVVLVAYLNQPRGSVVVICGITVFVATILINWRKNYSRGDLLEEVYR